MPTWIPVAEGIALAVVLLVGGVGWGLFFAKRLQYESFRATLDGHVSESVRLERENTELSRQVPDLLRFLSVEAVEQALYGACTEMARILTEASHAQGRDDKSTARRLNEQADKVLSFIRFLHATAWREGLGIKPVVGAYLPEGGGSEQPDRVVAN